MEIVLAGYYDLLNAKGKRYVNPAAAVKNDYLISSLLNLGISVTVFSIAPLLNKSAKSKEECFYDRNLTFYFCPQMNRKPLLTRKLCTLFSQKWLYKKLLKYAENKPLIVYHSLSLCNLLKKIKKKINCSLILEVEEVYSDLPRNKKAKEAEFSLFKIADKFIGITPVLLSVVNPHNKKSLVFYGPYSPIKRTNLNFQDKKIHLVYAGTIDETKGGLINSIKVASELPSNYVLHILSSERGNAVNDYIRRLVKNYSSPKKCSIIYEGSLNGDAFNSFLQKCQIGLALQDDKADFNLTSFPSKTITYLRNGLYVVSSKSKSFSFSPFLDIFIFENSSNISAIAKKIQAIDFSGYDYFEILNKLDSDFRKKLIELITDDF